MANAKVRAAKEAAKNAEVVPEFKNLPVRPKAGYRFVFARTVALEILEGKTGEDPQTTGLLKMSNKELEAELLSANVMYPEFMGGVVDDGKPNGIMPYPQQFNRNHQQNE
jgi:hypothetical protein